MGELVIRKAPLEGQEVIVTKIEEGGKPGFTMNGTLKTLQIGKCISLTNFGSPQPVVKMELKNDFIEIQTNDGSFYKVEKY